MPRYVILEHTGSASYKPGRHWDLMLEADGVLRTWELEAVPLSDMPVPARPLADHRLEYLDYEGPVGSDRGMVRQWDAGKYELLAETTLELAVQLDGRQLQGRLCLASVQIETGTCLISFEPT